MQKIFKVIFLFFILSTLAFSHNEKQVIVGVELEPDRINPLYDEDHDPVLSLIFSGLTTHNEKNEVIPELAKNWQVSDDGLEYIFDLREDVLWHDGEKFSADDVIFTINSALNPQNIASVSANYEMIKSVEKLGDYKIKITLSEPFPPFLDTLSFGVIPKHILENQNILNSKFNENPIGTGAFKFKKWKKGEFIEFEKNENFYKEQADIKNLFLKIIPDANVRLIQLKSEDIDVALIDPASVKSLENNKKLEILKFKSADYRALMFNIKHQILKDKNVRVALNYFVNKDEIVQKLLHNYGVKIDNPISLFLTNDTLSYEFNPKKGNEILQSIGWKKNKNGIYEKDGKILTFDIYTFNTDPLRITLAKALNNQFNKFGIASKAYSKPKTAFKIEEVDSFIIGWGSPFDPDFHTYRIFGSFADVDTNDAGWNYSHYKDADVDMWLKKARNLSNFDDRKKAYNEFLKAIYKNPPFIFIANIDYPLAYNKRISNIKTQILGHHGAGFLWNIREWKVK